jgi:hypothetical protein
MKRSLRIVNHTLHCYRHAVVNDLMRALPCPISGPGEWRSDFPCQAVFVVTAAKMPQLWYNNGNVPTGY